jgi:uncharacterized protein (TIGR03437 family)
MRLWSYLSLPAPRAVFALTLATFLSLPLVAQTPRMQWTRQFGSSGADYGNAVGYGEFGVFVAGYTQGTLPGQTTSTGRAAFLSLHDEAGTLKWIRQFGSTTNRDVVATGTAGDGSGAYVVGYTAGPLATQSLIGGTDSFIRKYDDKGEIVWTRQFGSPTDDFAYGVATHTSGVYVVGQVDCCAGSLPGLPTTASNDAYIRKYDGNGNELWTKMISTINTERALSVAVDSTGVFVAGTTNGDLAGPAGQRDGYVRKYNHEGVVQWTRQFGTQRADGVNSNEDVFAVAVGAGGVFVTGSTAQGTVPGGIFAGGLWDGFLVKLNADGVVQWYRQIGTTGDDYANAVAVGAGHVLVAGGTGGNMVDGAFVGSDDAFLRLYDFDGGVLGTLQFGNGGNDAVMGVVAFPGGFFAGGYKNGISLGLEAFGDNDVFAMKLIPPPFVPAGAILNGASFAASPAPLAPGSIAVAFGAYLNDGPQVLSTAIGADGKVVTSLGGTEIKVNDIAAPFLYSTAGQVSFQIPFEVAGQTAATVVVTVGGQTSGPRSINIAPAAPGFFTQNQAGTGEAVVVHEDGVSIVTPQSPAKRNEIVIFYLTGLGVLSPALGTGVPAAANTTAAQVSLQFGGANAVIEYAGAAPGFIGLNQINARIPGTAPIANNVPVSIIVGGRQANPVTIAIGQ